MATKPKFRPALTEDDLRILYADCREGPTKTYLKQYLGKIGLGIVTSGYVPTGTKETNTLSALGFPSESPKETDTESYKERPPEVLLPIFLSDPIQLTSAEINSVQNYRYLNDLMSPQEEKEYEQGQL